MGHFSTFFFAIYFLILSSLQNRRGICVLMYHRIRDDLPPGPLVIPVQTFREQMKYLKNYCEIISIKQMCQFYADGQQIPRGRRPKVVITFDDGYRDTYMNAFPVLKEFDLKATVFLATDFIGTDKKMESYSHFTSVDMLSWEEARSMQEAGIITFAAHTATHPHLPQLSFADQKTEIAKSIKTVDEHLSEEVARSVFCYPYGQYNQDTLSLMQEMNIKIAFTVRSGFNTGEENSIELKRVCADGSHTLVDFMRRLNPLPSCIQWRIDMLKDYRKKIYSKKEIKI